MHKPTNTLIELTQLKDLVTQWLKHYLLKQQAGLVDSACRITLDSEQFKSIVNELAAEGHFTGSIEIRDGQLHIQLATDATTQARRRTA